jgi:hypothetical protein
VAKGTASAAQNFAAGFNATQAAQAWPQLQTAQAGAWLTPYAANVVWQDTTSNATYCSASAALTT